MSGISPVAFRQTAFAQTTGVDPFAPKKLQYEHPGGSQGLPKMGVSGTISVTTNGISTKHMYSLNKPAILTENRVCRLWRCGTRCESGWYLSGLPTVHSATQNKGSVTRSTHERRLPDG